MADLDADLEMRLRKALQALTQRNGIYRDDLLQLLDTQLAPLRDVWGLSAYVQKGIDSTRDALARHLLAVTNQLLPPKRDPRDAELKQVNLSDDERLLQFRKVLGTLFNVRDTHPKSAQAERFEWLDSEANVNEAGKSLRIKEGTARRDLNYAIDEVSKSLASQIRRIRAGVASPPAYSAQVGEQASTQQESDTPRQPVAIPTVARRTRQPFWRRPVSLVATAIGVIALLVTALILVPADEIAGSPTAARDAMPSGQSGDVLDEPYSLTVLTNTDQIRFAEGEEPFSSYYFDKRISEVPPPPPGSSNCTGKHQWALGNGGQSASGMAGQFSIFARDQTVDILQAKIEIVEVLKPDSGVFVSCDSGSPIESRIVAIGLSDDRPSTIDYYPNGVVAEPAPFAFKIKPQETELFQFNAFSLSGSVRWHIVLVTTVDGQQEDIVVDNNGEDFITYNYFPGGKSYAWDSGKWFLLGE